MTNPVFTWDEAKSRSNRKNHEIDFEVAALVFRNPLHLMRQDRIADGEERWQTSGVVYAETMLLVAHTITEELTEEGPVETIRIISARRATRMERKRYETENS